MERRPAISRPPSLNHEPYPWLVIFDGENDSRQTFYSVSQNRYYVREIPEMRNKFIVSSQGGWLFLKDNVTDDCSLFNLYTLEKVQLPPLFIDPHHDTVLSSSHTKILDKSCCVLVVKRAMNEFKSCYVGDGEFVNREYCTGDYTRLIGAVLNYQGKMYLLTMDYWYLFVADFDQLDFTPVINGERSHSQKFKITNGTKIYLIESNGEILFVYTNSFFTDCMDIKIFKADMEMEEWVEIKHLGDRALFLDYYKGLSYSTTMDCGLKGNCVNYVNSCRDRNLYVYDMADRTVTMTLPCPTVSNRNSSLFWAM